MFVPTELDLRATLELDLSEPVRTGPAFFVRQAAESATIQSLKLVATAYDADGLRELTEAERNRVAYNARRLRLRGPTETVVDHHAPKGSHFTLRELLNAVEETERQTRGHGGGGVDVHHVYFEGIESVRGGDVWQIVWGS